MRALSAILILALALIAGIAIVRNVERVAAIKAECGHPATQRLRAVAGSRNAECRPRAIGKAAAQVAVDRLGARRSRPGAATEDLRIPAEIRRVARD